MRIQKLNSIRFHDKNIDLNDEKTETNASFTINLNASVNDEVIV